MSKQVKIQIFRDGSVQADVMGIKGKKCTDYIRILEELLEAETVDSAYTPEHYEAENVETVQSNQEMINR